MSWRKWTNLVSCVGFQKIDGSDLEGLVFGLDGNLPRDRFGNVRFEVTTEGCDKLCVEFEGVMFEGQD